MAGPGLVRVNAMRPTLLALALLAAVLPAVPSAAAVPFDCGSGIAFHHGEPASNAPIVWRGYDSYVLAGYFLDQGPHCGPMKGTLVLDGVRLDESFTFVSDGDAPGMYKVGWVGSPFQFTPGWHTATATLWENCDLNGGCDRATGTWSFFVAPWTARVGIQSTFEQSIWHLASYYSEQGTFDVGVPTPVCAPPAPCEAAHVSPRLGPLEGEGVTVDLVTTPPPQYASATDLAGWALAIPQGSPRAEADARTSVGGTVTVAETATVPFLVPVDVSLP